jgi:hypothetical protein
MKSKKKVKSRIDRTDVDRIRDLPFVPAWEKWRGIGELVLGDLKGGGCFFNSPLGLIYFDKDERRAFPLYENVALGALISQRYGINPKEYGFKRVLADLQNEAERNGTLTEVRRLAHYDRRSNCLYVSQFNGFMYKLDGSAVVQVPNGSDDVFFFDDRKVWEPYQYLPTSPKGQLDKQLIDSVNFEESALSVVEQRLFLKLWLMSVFFGSIQPTKIILLLLGLQGAGKTSALRRIQKFIFGSKVNLLSIEKDKPDGFVATVTSDPIALFDNLDERIAWLPYNLSRLATGVTFSRRQLYTTNDKVEFPGVSWLGITARTVDFMKDQVDLPDRTLVLKLGRLIDRKPEDELLCDVDVHRNAMWSELLDDLNRVVRHLQQHPGSESVQFRMADFATLALKIATVWGRRPEVEAALRKLEQAQGELVLQDDPISLFLGAWLDNATNHGRDVNAGTLFEEWRRIAAHKTINWPFLSPKGLGQRLSQVTPALREQFEVQVGWDGHTKQHRYRFWPKEGQRADEAPLPAGDVTGANQSVMRALAGAAGPDQSAETPRQARDAKTFEEVIMELYPKR